MTLLPSLLSRALRFLGPLLLLFHQKLFNLFLLLNLALEGLLFEDFEGDVLEVFGAEVGPFMLRHVPVDDSIHPIVLRLMIIGAI